MPLTLDRDDTEQATDDTSTYAHLTDDEFAYAVAHKFDGPQITPRAVLLLMAALKKVAAQAASIDRDPARPFIWHPNSEDLENFHAVMEKVMPDDTTAKPGSAHAAIQERIAPNRYTVEVIHIKTGEGSRHCAAKIEISTAAAT